MNDDQSRLDEVILSSKQTKSAGSDDICAIKANGGPEVKRQDQSNPHT